MVEFSITIPTLNSSKNIGKCLRQISEQDFPLDQVEVVVVDGFSSDDTVKIVEEHAQKVRYPTIRIYKKKERNIAASRNLGIEKSLGNTVIFLDSDCFPANSSWLQNLTAMEGKDEIVVGRNLVPPDTTVHRFIRSLDQLGTPDIAKECKKEIFYHYRWGGFPATNIAIRKEVFQKIGLLDEDIGSCREDMDFALRARKSGTWVKYTSRAIVNHEPRDSIISLWRTNYHRQKNSVGFYKKYGIFNRYSRMDVAGIIAAFTTLAFLLFTLSMSFVLFTSFALILYLLLLGKFLTSTRDSAFSEVTLYPFIYAILVLVTSLGTAHALFVLLHARLKCLRAGTRLDTCARR